MSGLFHPLHIMAFEYPGEQLTTDCDQPQSITRSAPTLAPSPEAFHMLVRKQKDPRVVLVSQNIAKNNH